MGLIGWAKERLGWNAAADWLAGLLFSLGMLGTGPPAVERKDALVKWLKGHREQTLGPVLEAYEASVKEGIPLLKNKPALIALLGTILQFVPQIQAMLPPGSAAWTLLATLALWGAFIVSHNKVEAEQAKERTSRNLLQSRQLDGHNVTRALAALDAGKSVTVNLGGPA